MPRRREPSLRSSSSTPHLINQPSSSSSPQTENDTPGLSKGQIDIQERSGTDTGTKQSRRPRRTSSLPTLHPSPLPTSPPSFSKPIRDASRNEPVTSESLVDSSSFSTALKPQSSNSSSSLFLPPHYGRPSSRPSSPLVLSTLFHPVLRSLSRPSSPPPPPPSSPLSKTPQRSQSSLPSHFPPRLSTDPAPTVESQGFLLYISSLLFYISYLIWSSFPGTWLERIGIEWFPSQEWALLIPSWITMTVVYVYLGYMFLNISNNSTPLFVETDEEGDLIDSYSQRDPKASVKPLLLKGDLANRFGEDTSRLWFDSIGYGQEEGVEDDERIPPLYDLPLDVVNRVLYD